MKILKMKLENFQGVKELEIDPQGESSAIYGDNGTGKSTVYNAFTWLMYGKPSTTEKNYTPKTTGSHNLHHSVEMTVELADGSEMVLKKITTKFTRPLMSPIFISLKNGSSFMSIRYCLFSKVVSFSRELQSCI